MRIDLRPLILSVAVAACGGDSPKTSAAKPAPAPAAQAPTGTAPAAATDAAEPAATTSVPMSLAGGDQPITELGRLAKPNGIAAQKRDLGELLFFDPRLSGTGTTSCSSCHLPEKGWTDGRQFSPKDGGGLNTRNAPTMVTAAACENLYWDGRAQGLDANVLAAWKGQMGVSDTSVIANRLAGIAEYARRFDEIYKTPPHERAVVQALAQFLRLMPFEAPFDRWQAGDEGAVGADAKAGYDLFLGKAGCAICHLPPLFTDKLFHSAGIGMDADKPDLGRGKIVNDPKLNGWFKTPTLRNSALTAPYFHDGSVATLEEAVRLMASGGRDSPTKSPELIDRKLSDTEIGQLVAFLKSLTQSQKYTPPRLPE